MDGPSENPFNNSLGTGTGLAVYDDVAHTLALSASFSGLTGTVTQTHFHAITATSGLPDNNPVGETRQDAARAVTNVSIAVGNTTLPGFPLGVQAGVYNQVLDLTQVSVYNGAFATANGGAAGAEVAFAGALASGRTYWNIHSSTSPGGEIRGFPFLVPEPTSFALASVMLLGLIGVRRRN
jgi:hypothetical protein